MFFEFSPKNNENIKLLFPPLDPAQKNKQFKLNLVVWSSVLRPLKILVNIMGKVYIVLCVLGCLSKIFGKLVKLKKKNFISLNSECF